VHKLDTALHYTESCHLLQVQAIEGYTREYN